jgi:hypothetical protein
MRPLSRLIATGLVMLACGCSSKKGESNRDLLIGEWRLPGDTAKMEFSKDGQVVIGRGVKRVTPDGESVETPPTIGSYSFVDDTSIQMVIKGNGEGTVTMARWMTIDMANAILDGTLKINATVSVSGDELVFQPEKSEKLKYERVK